jgi:hypothetical protein
MSVDEDQVAMYRRAAFGKQMEHFMSSDIGNYLIARAHEQKLEAQEAFLTVDCNSALAVYDIQNRILVANSVVGWMLDAVNDGLQAINIIEDRSGENG